MASIFGLLYLVIFLGFIITSFIILFHISRYSLNQRVATLSGLLFSVVMLVLLATNIFLFFSLPWNTLISSSL